MSWSTNPSGHPFQPTLKVALLYLACLLTSPLYAAAQVIKGGLSA